MRSLQIDFRKWSFLILPAIIIYSVMVFSGLVGSFYKPIIAVLLSMIVILVFSNFKALNQISLLILCGKYCLPIYLIHSYLTAGTRVVFRAMHVENIWIYIISGMVLGVVVPIFIYKMCNKIKYLQFVFKPENALKRIGVLKG